MKESSGQTCPASRLSKPLRYELSGWYVARRGDYRVTFRILDDDQVLLIGRIEHRADRAAVDVPAERDTPSGGDRRGSRVSRTPGSRPIGRTPDLQVMVSAGWAAKATCCSCWRCRSHASITTRSLTGGRFTLVPA